MKRQLLRSLAVVGVVPVMSLPRRYSVLSQTTLRDDLFLAVVGVVPLMLLPRRCSVLSPTTLRDGLFLSNHLLKELCRTPGKIRMSDYIRDVIQMRFLKYTARQMKFHLIKTNDAWLSQFFAGAKDRQYQIWERNSLSKYLLDTSGFLVVKHLKVRS